MFYQDGNIELEIRLTGILQVYVQGQNEPNLFGTTLAPGVNAHYHQHLFSLRVDPMVDGLHNTVMETDVLSLPTSPTSNHSGNAFYTRSAPVAGGRDFDYETDRRWAIVNPGRAHPVSGKPVGYGIMGKGGVTPLMARGDSWVAKRARWAERALWVVREREGARGGRARRTGRREPAHGGARCPEAAGTPTTSPHCRAE